MVQQNQPTKSKGILVTLIASEKWLTPIELSEMLQIPLDTLYQWRNRKFGPRAYKIGRHLRYRESQVIAWAESQ